jgi:hypothetical protein
VDPDLFHPDLTTKEFNSNNNNNNDSYFQPQNYMGLINECISVNTVNTGNLISIDNGYYVVGWLGINKALGRVRRSFLVHAKRSEK